MERSIAHACFYGVLKPEKRRTDHHVNAGWYLPRINSMAYALDEKHRLGTPSVHLPIAGYDALLHSW
jgi:hypothetical protein